MNAQDPYNMFKPQLKKQTQTQQKPNTNKQKVPVEISYIL